MLRHSHGPILEILVILLQLHEQLGQLAHDHFCKDGVHYPLLLRHRRHHIWCSSSCRRLRDLFVSLWGVEAHDKCEGGVGFGQISEDMAQSSHFCQLHSIDGVHEIGLKVVRSAGIRIRSESPTRIDVRSVITEFGYVEIPVRNSITLTDMATIWQWTGLIRHDTGVGLSEI